MDHCLLLCTCGNLSALWIDPLRPLIGETHVRRHQTPQMEGSGDALSESVAVHLFHLPCGDSLQRLLHQQCSQRLHHQFRISTILRMHWDIRRFRHHLRIGQQRRKLQSGDVERIRNLCAWSFALLHLHIPSTLRSLVPCLPGDLQIDAGKR